MAKYAVEWQPDDKRLLRVGNPRLYEHPYQSPQQPLWPLGEVEWFMILRCETTSRRRKRKLQKVIQLALTFGSDSTQG